MSAEEKTVPSMTEVMELKPEKMGHAGNCASKSERQVDADGYSSLPFILPAK